jgi:hypothetical protein
VAVVDSSSAMMPCLLLLLLSLEVIVDQRKRVGC